MTLKDKKQEKIEGCENYGCYGVGEHFEYKDVKEAVLEFSGLHFFICKEEMCSKCGKQDNGVIVSNEYDDGMYEIFCIQCAIKEFLGDF